MKIFRFIIALILISSGVNAQEIELKELTAPSSPAFTILGLNPTEITRPTLAKPFVMDLANGLDGKSISANIAVESTPFWWKPHRGLTYKKYYGLENDTVRKNLVNTIKQTTAFSFATSDASPEIDSIDSRFISMGLRFMVLKGKPSSIFDSTYHALRYDLILKRESISQIMFKVDRGIIKSFEQLNDEIATSIDEVITSDTVLKVLPANKKKLHRQEAIEYITAFLKQMDTSVYKKDKVWDFLEVERQVFIKPINETLVEMQGMSRVGWMLEFAGAASLLAPTNNIDLTYGHEWGGWATLTYRFDTKKGSKVVNDFNLMARLGGDFNQTNSYNRDFGVSWVTSGHKYSLTLEGIFRSFRSYKQITATDGIIYDLPETNNTWRFALAYQYKFTDFLNVSLTAGKDFENSYLTSGGIFSLLNINLILPSKQVISVKE
jgi:hypothetical protein